MIAEWQKFDCSSVKTVTFMFISQELSQKFGDEKSLPDHLQLPIQRINDYQLLLKVCEVW